MLIYGLQAVTTDKSLDFSNIINQLLPNYPVLIAHIVATVILLIVLKKWVYKPFRTLLHDRHLIIKNKLDSATQKEVLANNKHANAIQMLNNAKNEATKIIVNAKTKADEIHRTTIEKTRNEIALLNHEAKSALLAQKKSFAKKIENKIKEVGFEIAKKILVSEINEKKHQQLINDFIKQLKKMAKI